MNKHVFISWVLLFILIISGVPFYWFAYRPKKIRAECLAISMSAAFDYKKGYSTKEKILDYYRYRADFGGDAKKEELLFLMARQKDGYRICLELNGLKE